MEGKGGGWNRARESTKPQVVARLDILPEWVGDEM